MEPSPCHGQKGRAPRLQQNKSRKPPTHTPGRTASTKQQQTKTRPTRREPASGRRSRRTREHGSRPCKAKTYKSHEPPEGETGQQTKKRPPHKAPQREQTGPKTQPPGPRGRTEPQAARAPQTAGGAGDDGTAPRGRVKRKKKKKTKPRRGRPAAEGRPNAAHLGCLASRRHVFFLLRGPMPCPTLPSGPCALGPRF